MESPRDTGDRSGNQIRVTISLGNRQETLILSETPAFSNLRVVNQSGQATTSATRAYEGKIASVANSWVRLTVTGDALDGVIDTGTQRTYISSEPVAHPDRSINSVRTALDKIVHAPLGRRTIQEVVEIPVSDGFDSSTDQVSRVAKIGIVVDSYYNEALGGRGLANAISAINTVDGLYQQEFGLALKVDTAIIITDTETMGLGNISLEDNLARFREYRLDENVGLAYLDSACREDGYDVSLSTPFEFRVLLAAHEIGHNLGAMHDDQTELCSNSEEWLMHSLTSQFTTNQFSVCSHDAIDAHLQDNACYFAAIDLSLTLTRDGKDGVIALITNTDAERAFPSADLDISLKNASIASAPASCNIDNTSELNCIIPTTLPGESQTLNFTFRFDETEESTIDASLQAIGFIDTKTINNNAQIVMPAEQDEDSQLTLSDADTSTPAETIASGDSTDNDTGASGGGGVLSGIIWLLVLLLCERVYRLTVSRRFKIAV